MQSKSDAWLQEYRHELHTTHSMFVDAQSGFDFCQKLGIIPEISGGSLRAMTKEEQFDGKEVQVTFSNWVSIYITCLLYTSPSPRDGLLSRMPSSA